MTFTVLVVGTPAPQGSKRGFVVNGHVTLKESSAKVKPWRQDVTAAVLNAIAITPGFEPYIGPVRVDITYYLTRPRYHFRTGKRANELRPDAPAYVDKKPDKDKLDRATYDALTASGVVRDDAQIAAGYTEKVYADRSTGARITITPLTPPTAAGPASTHGPAARPDALSPSPMPGRPATSHHSEGALF